MRSKSAVGLFLAAHLFFAVTVLAQGTYKSEPAPAAPGADIPAALAGLLQPQGIRVLDASGAPYCEIWLSKAVPLKASTGTSADVIYGNLEVGTLVGAIHFPNKGSDFRGQPIKPGYYTLRYALIPQDGNHMGVNPTRDFLLMSPVAQDAKVDQLVALNDLLNLSRKASGTNHPAILCLEAANGAAALVQDDQQHWVLQGQAQGQMAGGQLQNFPVAFVVVGQTQAGE